MDRKKSKTFDGHIVSTSTSQQPEDKNISMVREHVRHCRSRNGSHRRTRETESRRNMMSQRTRRRRKKSTVVSFEFPEQVCDWKRKIFTRGYPRGDIIF